LREGTSSQARDRSGWQRLAGAAWAEGLGALGLGGTNSQTRLVTAAQASDSGLIQNVIQQPWAAQTWVRAVVATGQPPLVEAAEETAQHGGGWFGAPESKILGFDRRAATTPSDVSKAEPQRREAGRKQPKMTR